VAAVAARERRVPHWSPDRIERLQRRRVRAIVAYAYENVPFYRDVMRDRGLAPEDFRGAEDLARLPRQAVRVRGADGREAAYGGVALVEVLRSAGVEFGPDLGGPALATFLVVEAADEADVQAAVTPTGATVAQSVVDAVAARERPTVRRRARAGQSRLADARSFACACASDRPRRLCALSRSRASARPPDAACK